MSTQRPVDSSGSFTNTEDARLQFVIVRQHIGLETDDSFVLTGSAEFRPFQKCAESSLADGVPLSHKLQFSAVPGAKIVHDRVITAGAHGLYGLRNRD